MPVPTECFTSWSPWLRGRHFTLVFPLKNMSWQNHFSRRIFIRFLSARAHFTDKGWIDEAIKPKFWIKAPFLRKMSWKYYLILNSFFFRNGALIQNLGLTASSIHPLSVKWALADKNRIENMPGKVILPIHVFECFAPGYSTALNNNGIWHKELISILSWLEV